jgi:hypothetical protein
MEEQPLDAFIKAWGLLLGFQQESVPSSIVWENA